MTESRAKKKGFWRRVADKVFSEETAVAAVRTLITTGATAAVVGGARYGYKKYKDKKGGAKLYSIKSKSGS